jgi:hypothetical protein
MSSKERIQIVRQAIESVKSRVNEAVANGNLVDLSCLMLDLGALEQCLDIEMDTALKHEDELELMNQFYKQLNKAS